MNRGLKKVIFVGLIALVGSLVVTGIVSGTRQRAEQRRVVRVLFASIDDLRQRRVAQNAALQARFDQIDIDSYLVPARLSSAEGVRDGRAELARYRVLLAERDRLMQGQVQQIHALFTSLPPGSLREQTLRDEASEADRSSGIRARLSQSQLANVDAVQAMFDWAARYHAILHAHDNALLVDGAPQLAEFQALQTRVRDSGQPVQDAIAEAKDTEERSAQALASVRKGLDK